MQSKSIFFLVPYPRDKAPSQRFRFEQYFNILIEKGYTFKVKSFYSKKTWEILHREGNLVFKVFYIFLSFIVRIKHVFASLFYSVVFIHREVSPIGPPVFEWILKYVLRKKIVYDFDDAIWLPNYSEANAGFHKLKSYKKVNKIMEWATVVSCGNKYLSEYALKFNSNIVINPTTVDTFHYHNRDLYNISKSKGVPVIGWTGTHTTIKYLEFLIPILNKLKDRFDFEFCVISNEKPILDLPFLNYIKWSKETEIEDLMRFDIGVMPLANNKWAKGKCGFKALQYMSLGIPTIASPVGVNIDIIDEMDNGFLCETEEDWLKSLVFLLQKSENRLKMSESAKLKVHSNFSVSSNSTNFISLFNI